MVVAMVQTLVVDMVKVDGKEVMVIMAAMVHLLIREIHVRIYVVSCSLLHLSALYVKNV